MNSVERIRAYLNARYTQFPDLPEWIDGTPDVMLTTTDLEVVLQMLDLLSILIAGRSKATDDPISREYVLMKAEQQVTGQ